MSLARLIRARRAALAGTDQQPEEGFILIAVVLLMAMLLILALTAFTSAWFLTVSSVDPATRGDADQTAQAGVAMATYYMSIGNWSCQISESSTPVPSGPPNALPASYSVTIAYYSSSGTALCPSGGGGQASTTPATATITSTATAASGSRTAKETIVEDVDINDISAQTYTIFSGGQLNLNKLTVAAPSGTQTAGEIFADGPVSITAPPKGCEAASIVSIGDMNLAGNCPISGSIEAVGNLTLSAGVSVSGNAVAGNGDLVASHSAIDGTATAIGGSSSGDVVLCPATSDCNGTTGPAGTSTVGSTATASGYVSVGGTVFTTSASPPCASTNAGGDTVTGCITAGSGASPSSPSLGLPTLPMPTASSNPWTSAGYSGFQQLASCTQSALTAVVNTESVPTVVEMPSGCDLALNPGGGPGQPALQVPYSTAVFSPCGFTVSGGNLGPPPPGSTAAQLSLIVPSGTYTCSSTADITFSGQNMTNPQPLSLFLYTPYSVDNTSGNLVMDGEIIAGTIGSSASAGLTSTAAVTYAACTVPGISFGYDVSVVTRLVTVGP